MPSDRTIANGGLDDLAVFAVVARTKSFSRAAGELGMSNSMLSYTIRRLEQRLGLVLLRRTSRSVAVTEAGEKLLQTLQPALQALEDTLQALREARMTGLIRITATRQAYDAVIRPALRLFGEAHPHSTLEVMIDYGFRDIVAEGFDAGIRLGEKLEQDMIALRLGPDLQMTVVASPDYLSHRSKIVTPEDLRAHRCINYRLVSANSLYAWEFEKDGKRVALRVDGPLAFNEPELMLQAAIDGLGVAYLLEHEARPHIASGRLIALLTDWTAPFPGFYLYYPSRRQASPPFSALLAILREQARARIR